jgi:hypothetical protein
VTRNWIAAVLMCAACSTGPLCPERRQPQPLAEIPVEIRHGIPTVNVLISGNVFRLFLDLGGHQAISLTSEELARANVRFLDRTVRFANSSGQILESRQFVAQNVVLDNFALGDLEGGESNFGDAAPPDRNGYIGMPVLGKYLLVLDYPAKRIRLYRSGDALALENECGRRTFTISLVDGTALSVATTEFGDRLFVWDTGTTSNFIRPSSIPVEKSGGRVVDDGPPIIGIESLSLGEQQLGPQEFRLVQFGAPAVDGYLGSGVFASRRVCLDIPQGKGAIGEAS